MTAIAFPPPPPCPQAETLRLEVRDFLAAELAGRTPRQRAESWNGYDRDFSRKMGQRGWIGMTWPKRYGGHERSALERYVVLEEMLAAGAPVNMHWIADRQSGPLLLRAGTEAQRSAILPRIAAGECGFCIGMSEPDSGSDLASVRTRAAPVQGGFLVNGTKLWTSGAHLADYMILFCRTGPGERHEGTSQLLVDLKHTKGLSIRPVRALSGEHHFNEVVFTDAFLPEDAVIGQLGQGWQQVTSELAYERSGPERFLSSFQVVVELLRAAGPAPSERVAVAVGRLAAHMIALRRMSRSVAGMLQQGGNPALEAALVKEVGNTLEQEIPEIVRLLLEAEPEADGADQLAAVLGHTMLHIPSFSLRGGTREVLRGMIARGLGLR
ncbi:MAG: acyl-CoA dehydrogenase family protein [Rhodospirillales bacterium]|nr:acyl-CoA dehydrogenase family protein [Rhodospirillales bacterium]